MRFGYLYVAHLCSGSYHSLCYAARFGLKIKAIFFGNGCIDIFCIIAIKQY